MCVAMGGVVCVAMGGVVCVAMGGVVCVAMGGVVCVAMGGVVCVAMGGCLIVTISWHRYFCLTDKRLYYAKGKPDVPLCTIRVEDILGVEQVDDDTFNMKFVSVMFPSHVVTFMIVFHSHDGGNPCLCPIPITIVLILYCLSSGCVLSVVCMCAIPFRCFRSFKRTGFSTFKQRMQ